MLDNCEHLIGGCAKTAEAIVRRCPKVHLLATSREPLGIGGERIYRVPSLSLPGPGDPDSSSSGSCDAIALFADRARAQGVALDVDELAGPVVVSVCRRWPGCRWPSSWPRRGCGRCHSVSCTTGWISGSGC